MNLNYKRRKYLPPHAEELSVSKPTQILARLSIGGDFDEYLEDGGEAYYDFDTSIYDSEGVDFP